MPKRAFITGITGQDGSYLAELLLSKGYEVHGVIRRASTFNTHRIGHLYQDPHQPRRRLFLHYGDMTSAEWINGLIQRIRPEEVYHLAAQSHVKVSFDLPEYTAQVTGLGTCRMLESICRSGTPCRFYQASSSEMFGASPPPQNERTPFSPRSPYAAAKVYAYEMTRIYRQAYGLFACNGILFNHESPRRGETFVTRKITRGIALILSGKAKKLHLGNLEAQRDWGYAPEYVEAMWRMLQREKPEDYVLGTGEAHSVREFAQEAFRYAGLEWRKFLETDPRYLRPLETESLRADSAKARSEFGWRPQITFAELVRIMVDADMEREGLSPPGEGKRILKERFGRWHRWETAVGEVLRSDERAVE